MPSRTARNGKQREGNEDTITNHLLANASTVLEVAKEFAPLIPLPIVGSLFATGKIIIDSVQQIRQNKEDCARLAERVSIIIRDICKELRGREELVDERLNASLEQIYTELEEIKIFVSALNKQNWLKRIFKKEYATTQLNVFSAKLDFSLQTFKALSNIRMELRIEEIDRRLIKMDTRAHNERQWDGQYRIYRLADLELLRLISREEGILCEPSADEPSSSKSGHIKPYVIEHYEARLNDGRVVTVKRSEGYPKIYLDGLNALKKFKHVNVAQLEGYSDSSDSDVYFQVIKGGLNHMVAKMASLPTYERYVKYFNVVSSIFRTINDLRSRNMIIHSCSAKTVMCHPLTGEAVLGVHDQITLEDGPIEPGNLCSVWNFDWYLSDTIVSDNIEHVCFYLRSDLVSPGQSAALFTDNTSKKQLTLQQALTAFATFRNLLHGNNIRHMFRSGSHPPLATGCLLAFVPGKGLMLLGRFAIKEDYASNTHSILNWMIERYFTENLLPRCTAHHTSEIDISEHKDAPPTETYQLWKDLAFHGYAAAKATNVPLENLLLVKDAHLKLRAKCAVSPTKDSSSGTVYFHRHSPVTSTESGRKEIPVPWGYFSRDAEKRFSDTDPQNEDGLVSEIYHEWVIDYFRLSPFEASMIRWFHENLPASNHSNSSDKGKGKDVGNGSRIVEVED